MIVENVSSKGLPLSAGAQAYSAKGTYSFEYIHPLRCSDEDFPIHVQTFVYDLGLTRSSLTDALHLDLHL